jgi:Undecaprenyl-phosphate glucose phosphotransferase
MHVQFRPTTVLTAGPTGPDDPAAAPAGVLPSVPSGDRAIGLAVVARAAGWLDVVLLAAAAGLSARPAGPPCGQALVIGTMFVWLGVRIAGLLGAHRADRLFHPGRQTAAAALGVLGGAMGMAGMAALLTGGVAGTAPWISATWLVGSLLVVLRRLLLSLLLALWHAQGRLVRNVAVIGANDYSRSFIASVRADPGGTLAIAGLYDDRLGRLPADAALPIQGTISTLLTDARTRRIDVIVVALPLSATDRIAQIRDQLSATVSDIFLTADTAGLRYDGRDFETLGRNGVIRVGNRPLSDWDAAAKQALDIVGAGLLLALLSPILLTIAVLIRLDSPGPALFRQPRTGFNNRPFLVLKFRTMHAHLSDRHADRQTTRDDPRVTRLGRVLRRSSIDELPQLLNVLRGEMSLVGPRPHAANTKAANRYFDEVVAEYALRHRIKPGITGWAQVNGWRGETVAVEQIQQRVSHDLAYIENWSMLLDLKILALTLLRGGGKHVY